MGRLDFLTGNKKEKEELIAAKNRYNNAAVSLVQADKLLSAATSDLTEKHSETEAGNFQNLTTDNRFVLYQDLERITPQVAIPLIKLSLTLTKGMRFVKADSDKILLRPNDSSVQNLSAASEDNDKTNEGKKNNKEVSDELLLNFIDWSKRTNFKMFIQSMARTLPRDGTYFAIPQEESNYDLLRFEPLLLSDVTAYPKDYDPTAGNSGTVITGPPEKIYINEGKGDSEQEYNIINDNVFYLALYPYDLVVKDIKGNETFGIYGRSLVHPLIDLVIKYLNLVHGYTDYIRKYGIGRYHIDYKVLEPLIEDGQIDLAIEIMKKLSDNHKLIKENEDIIGSGFDIKQLDTGGSNINVTGFKESLETDIQVGLLQAPLTMGRAEGTTYASGYVSEADRLMVLEGIQSIIKDFVNQMIDYRLSLMKEAPGSIMVEFDDISKPDVNIRDMIDGYINAINTKGEVRIKMGLPEEMPEDKDEYQPRAPGVTLEGIDSRKKKQVVEFDENGNQIKDNNTTTE